MLRIVILLCFNPRASRPTPVSDVFQAGITSFFTHRLHVLLIKLRFLLHQKLVANKLADTDSFSYVTRTGDVTRCAAVVLDTVGTALLTTVRRCLWVRLRSRWKIDFTHQICRIGGKQQYRVAVSMIQGKIAKIIVAVRQSERIILIFLSMTLQAC